MKKIIDKPIHELDEVYEELKNKDIGIWTTYQYSDPQKTKNKVINIQLGRIWFNLLLPDDFYFVDKPVDKKELNKILIDLYEKYPANVISDTNTTMCYHIGKMMSINPVTFSIDDLCVPDDIKEKKKEKININTEAEDFATELTKLGKEHIDSFSDDSGIKQIINSGAKSSPSDFAVLMHGKGYVRDIEGNMRGPILNGQNDGYTVDEYYDSAAEARYALYVRAVGSQDPGVLARDVVYANSNVKVEIDDCKTKRYLEMLITETIFETIMGRYYLNEKTGEIDEVTDDLRKKFINKKIKLRSPLYCKGKSLCKVCYGKLSERLENKNVGVNAAQVINQAGIEGYAMSLRHQSLKNVMNKVNFMTDMVDIY